MQHLPDQRPALNAIALSDLRCVSCGKGSLTIGPTAEDGAVQLGIVHCSACLAAFDVIDGVPFIGHYERDDYIGLVEIVATSDQSFDPSRDASAEPIRSMNALLEDYSKSGDKDRFASEHENDMLRTDWWSHRYHEWLQVSAIIDKVDLNGARLLNVGAGTGADAVRLHDLGADVTCIDYSPSLTSMGHRMLPEARWFGGFSHVLPFQSETFDVVCANAALHHMRSVPCAIREMLRVLKPGGLLFTTGDPVRPDVSSEEHEFEVFNQHQSVLGGVNEGIVPVGQIYDSLAAFGPDVDVALLADIVEGPRLEHTTPIDQDLFGDAWVPLTPANIETLRRCHGSIATAVRKKRSISIEVPTQKNTLISPGVLASWMRGSDAFARLSAIAPKRFVDLPFPGRVQTWFDLLNGWMKPEPPFRARQGFRRARWLLQPPPAANRLEFAARSLCDGIDRLSVLIDGIEHSSHDLTDRWQLIRLSLVGTATNKPLLFELLWKDKDEKSSFEQRCFLVRDRYFRGDGLMQTLIFFSDLARDRLALASRRLLSRR